MKVLIISPHLNIRGGATRLVVTLARYLIREREYVEVWSHEVDIENTFEEAKYLNIKSIRRPCLNTLAYVFPPSRIKEFDVVNCHNYPSYLVTLNRKVKGKLVIWHCNEPPLALYPIPQQGSKTFQLHKLMRLLEKMAVRRLSTITVHSKMIGDRVKEIYGRKPLVLGPLGVDLKKFRLDSGKDIRAKYGIDDDPCIMTVAAFTKRLDLLLYAFLNVKKSFENAKLLLVGTSDRGTLRMLENTIKKFKLRQNVILAPNVDDDDLPSYYSACDIFIFPQPHWGFSLAIMEAMASGKPVIVPETCAAAEIINGNNGIVTNITNPFETAKKIVALIRDDDKRGEMGIAARKYAEKFLDINLFLGRYHKLLRQYSRK